MRLCLVALAVITAGCRGTPQPQPSTPAARHLLIVTIDTLRADRVGAYGDAAAQTPAIDALARRGTLFANAFAPTPVTLPSHASLMTGRYPAGHGARHNGMRLDLAVPTLAERLSQAGFATAAFVAAFPLDRRFGLIKGFQTYGDRMPRGADGRPANERAGRQVVDEALAWLARRGDERVFLWVHLFEPHAPYGDPRRGGSVDARYREDIAEADRQVARLLDGLGERAASTLVVLAADHGEAFGEHGEISHSVFVYDTTLRVPLVVAGPNVGSGARITTPVGLVDIAPTVTQQLGVGRFDADGADLTPALGHHEPEPRPLYAETFAPLLDFGWSPLRAVRDGEWKYIDAPKPELYRIASDPGEATNMIGSERPRAAAL
jgi:arylsulfatase A-like enzyme